METMNELYEDLNGNEWYLPDMTYERLVNLNYSEEVQFAKNVLAAPPFSEQRSAQMKLANRKIMQIAFWKKKKSNSLTKLEKKESYGATDASIKMLKELINMHRSDGRAFTFYEAGVGKASALKAIGQDKLRIYGCDVFLSEEAKTLARNRPDISLVGSVGTDRFFNHRR